MDLAAMVLGYFALTAVLIGVLLFGEAPWAAGTPVAWAHWAITRGWLEGVEWTAERACGQRGLQFLDNAAMFCCERSNPILQILYLTVVGVAYALYWRYVFALFPGNPVAPTYHIFVGTGALGLALVSFLFASTSDPGKITPQNAALYLAAYPPDGALFTGAACRTCAFPRPARSKHCGLCGSCVVRHDHHCGWLNNCVGLLNLRHFLAFLIANLLLAIYSAVLAGLAIWGDMQRRGALTMWVFDRGLGKLVQLSERPARLIEFVAVYYGVAASLCFFGTMCALLLVAFLAYQTWLIASGVTTYEAAKLRERARAAHEAARREREQRRRWPGAEEGEEEDEGRSGGGSGGQAAGDSRQQQREVGAAVQRQGAPYHRGSVWANFREVLWPDAFLREQLRRQGVREADWERERARGEASQLLRQRRGGGEAQEKGQQQQQAGGSAGAKASRAPGPRRRKV